MCIRDSFLTHPVNVREPRPVVEDEVPLFSDEELKKATGLMKSGKAPGPDGVPSEVLKVIASSCPRILLNVYNSCLKDKYFPMRWKVRG